MTRRAFVAHGLFRFWPLAAAAIFIAAYGLFWLEGASRMHRAIDKWAAAQRARGVDVYFGRVETTGFPFSWRGVVNKAAIGAPPQYLWSADTLYIDAFPFAPKRLDFSTDSSQTIDFGLRGRWRLDAATGRATIIGGKMWALEVSSHGSVLDGAGGARIASDRFRLAVAPSRRAAGLIEGDLVVEGLVVSGLARPIEAPVIEATFAFAIGSRNAPPRLEIRRFHAEGVGAKVELSGAISLDAVGFPAGAFNAEIANPGAIAELLGEIGAVSPAEAEEAAASLTLAALASGGKITAPLMLRDGEASIAGVAVAKLPRLIRETYAPSP